ncbi:hypothetical protein [Amycolatopsis pigmentata]|uniref:EspG family protein n=1 Tax=Amycolatopsis pigmentata TaxID=450801 RepID=A0ABW5FJB2_9PSEU
MDLIFGDAYLAPGVGTHRFVLPVKTIASWLDPEVPDSITPTLLTGTVWTDLPSFRWVAGLPTQTFTVRGYQVSEELFIDLSDEQLIALEDGRGEDDVALRIKLQATLLQADTSIHPVAHEETAVRISRARWLEQLDQIGHEVGIVVRVPSPLTDSALQLPPVAAVEDAPSLAQATARLRQARAELRDHQWEHCVATCRRILENIGRLVTLPPAKRIFAKSVDTRTQDERWAAIYYDTKTMTSAAHHDDTTTDTFRWSQADAEAVLATTAGLLKRYVTPS